MYASLRTYTVLLLWLYSVNGLDKVIGGELISSADGKRASSREIPYGNSYAYKTCKDNITLSTRVML